MLVRRYKNFDELFKKLVVEILTNTEEVMEYSTGISGYIDNMILFSDSWDCNLDLSKFGYTKDKWQKLLNTYVDYESLLLFRDKIKNLSGLSYTYYFKQKKVHNGSCMIAIVLSRESRKLNWSKVNVIYRTTEIQRRFAADLALVYNFINELPKECCDIKQVSFYMPQSFISAQIINGYFDYFGVPRDSINYDHPWTRALQLSYKRAFVDRNKLSKFKQLCRMQKLSFGMAKYEPLKTKELGIDKYFQGKGKRKR